MKGLKKKISKELLIMCNQNNKNQNKAMLIAKLDLFSVLNKAKQAYWEVKKMENGLQLSMPQIIELSWRPIFWKFSIKQAHVKWKSTCSKFNHQTQEQDKWSQEKK